MRIKKWLKELAAFAIIAFVIVVAVDWWRAPKMPEYANLNQQITLNGQPVDLQQLSQDKPVLIYFWATWCGICKTTTPMVKTLANDGVRVITVALQSGSDAELGPKLAGTGFTLPTINDADGAISADWGVSVTPTFAIVYQGNIVHSSTGWTSAWGLKSRLWLTTFMH